MCLELSERYKKCLYNSNSLQHPKMDNSGTVEQRLQRALDAVEELGIEKTALRIESVKLMFQFEDDLRKVRPKLAASTRKEKCLEAAAKLIEHGKKLSQQQKPQRDVLNARMTPFHARREELESFLTCLRQNEILRGLSEEQENKIDMAFTPLESHARLQNICNEGNYDIIVQGEVQKMMENQGDEEKHWVLLENNPFIAHLDRPRTTPCPGTVTGKRSTPTDSDFRHVPPELASLILKNCDDLETCVNLREVNSVFYQEYSHCETELRTKIMRRYPWFHREEDIFTWAECVLVYVKRITGGKWTTTENLDNLTCKQEKTPVKTLLSRPVRTLSDWVPSFVPFGIESEQEEFWEAAVSVNREGETVVKVDGFDKPIILPPGTHFERVAPGFAPLVVLIRHTVVVRQHKKVWVFFQSDPHYERAINTHRSHYYAFEFPMVFGIVKEETREGKSVYNFLDNLTGMLREFAPPTSAAPVGLYNGLMWWKVKGTDLVPTFVDLANPGKIYYRKDKIISVDRDEDSDTPSYQCNRGIHGSSRFLISLTRRGTLFVDFATSTVTEVLNHTEDVYLEPEQLSERVEMMPGFVNLKLDVRFMESRNLGNFLDVLKDRIDEDDRLHGAGRARE